MKNFLSIYDITSNEMMALFKSTQHFENYLDLLKVKHFNFSPLKKIIGTLFLEPSTRTRISFEAAMKRVGGNVVSVADGNCSSCAKGESISDAIRTMSQYVDLLVVRANSEYQTWGNNFDCPIINAGDGNNEHPSQALVDAYTIQKKFGTLKNLKVAIVGDLDNGRTAHSLLKLLLREGNKLYVCPPPHSKGPSTYDITSCNPSHFDKPPDLTTKLSTDQLIDILPEIDVLYMTRMQHERGTVDKPPLCLNEYLVKRMHSNAIIMHPMPRMEELPSILDDNPRSVYFSQSKNGVPVRMALIKWILE